MAKQTKFQRNIISVIKSAFIQVEVVIKLIKVNGNKQLLSIKTSRQWNKILITVMVKRIFKIQTFWKRVYSNSLNINNILIVYKLTKIILIV